MGERQDVIHAIILFTSFVHVNCNESSTACSHISIRAITNDNGLSMEKLLPLLCKWFQFHKEKASRADCTLAGPFPFTKASLIRSHGFFPPLASWIPTSRRTRGFVDQRRHHRHVSEALRCSAVRLSDMAPHCQRERSKGDPNGPCASTERSSRSCRFHIMKLFITRLKLSEGNEISSLQKRKKKRRMKLFTYVLKERSFTEQRLFKLP